MSTDGVLRHLRLGSLTWSHYHFADRYRIQYKTICASYPAHFEFKLHTHTVAVSKKIIVKNKVKSFSLLKR